MPISKELIEVSKLPWFPIVMKELGYEPVRHGRWIFNPKDGIEMMFTLPKCSECGAESPDGGNYCPNCGARMDVTRVDSVEVVRYKDCRFFHKYGYKLERTECIHFDCDVAEDGYCAWGERR